MTCSFSLAVTGLEAKPYDVPRWTGANALVMARLSLTERLPEVVVAVADVTVVDGHDLISANPDCRFFFSFRTALPTFWTTILLASVEQSRGTAGEGGGSCLVSCIAIVVMMVVKCAETSEEFVWGPAGKGAGLALSE